MDRRARQFVPLYVHFAESKLGVTLKQEFGAEGLAVWACLLAAAKRNLPQGTFRYSSESDAWAQLGLLDATPNFTFEAFLKVTGRMKQTSRTSSGHLSNVLISSWTDHNDEFGRQLGRERKSSKTGTNTRNMHGGNTEETGTIDGPKETNERETPTGSLSLAAKTKPKRTPGTLAPGGPAPGYDDLHPALRAAYPRERLERHLADPDCRVDNQGRIHLGPYLLAPHLYPQEPA